MTIDRYVKNAYNAGLSVRFGIFLCKILLKSLDPFAHEGRLSCISILSNFPNCSLESSCSRSRRLSSMARPLSNDLISCSVSTTSQFGIAIVSHIDLNSRARCDLRSSTNQARSKSAASYASMRMMTQSFSKSMCDARDK